MRDIFFSILCAAMLGLAWVTVSARNLFRSALGLLGVLLCTAVLFLLLRAELVALVQVMVYIGGIMIFVLYAVLLTSELGGKMAQPSVLKLVSASAVSVTALCFLVNLAFTTQTYGKSLASDAATSGGIATLQSLGLRLLDAGPDGFLVPFELISVLLLAAMVGAIALARPSESGQKISSLKDGKLP